MVSPASRSSYPAPPRLTGESIRFPVAVIPGKPAGLRHRDPGTGRTQRPGIHIPRMSQAENNRYARYPDKIRSPAIPLKQPRPQRGGGLAGENSLPDKAITIRRRNRLRRSARKPACSGWSRRKGPGRPIVISSRPRAGKPGWLSSFGVRPLSYPPS